MNSLLQDQDIVFKKNIDDSTTLICYDKSRLVAGDRWLIELQCKITMKNNEEFWAPYNEEDLELLACIREKIGQEFFYSFTQKKFFVDDSEKETVLRKIIDQVKENSMKYFSHPKFSMNFFAQKYTLARDECRTVNSHVPSSNVDDNKYDDEPVDFSHLFNP